MPSANATEEDIEHLQREIDNLRKRIEFLEQRCFPEKGGSGVLMNEKGKS